MRPRSRIEDSGELGEGHGTAAMVPVWITRTASSRREAAERAKASRK